MIFRIYIFTVCLAIPFFCASLSHDMGNIRNIDSYYVTNKDQILKYFLDVVYENSFCRCQGNDGCTRGCRSAARLNRGEYAPVRRCEGKKPMGRSYDYCARHVTGSIMTLIHNFLYFHCNIIDNGTLMDIEDYRMCADRFNTDIRNNNIHICRHGFVFHAALCMLNLDGHSFNLYNSIANRSIRSTCKNWDRYNQMLTHVNASIYYGQTTIIPMFKKIPSERYREFQANPAEIPEGAIVVTDSFINPEGHVEIRMNKNECGRNKNQPCFCSDFCRERSTYHQNVLAVFEWNPEFIKYLWNTLYWARSSL